MNNHKLLLGSVQFGMPYGIINNKNKVFYNDAFKILDTAYNSGINMIDSAPSYGDSEEVIGNATYGQSWNIITKTPHYNKDIVVDLYLEDLWESLYRSLNSLNTNSIYGLLVHNCDDLFKQGGRRIFLELEKMRSTGVVSKIGVSVYTDKQILRVLDNFDIDIIQLPVNIFDQRLVNSRCLDTLKKKGIEVHARSVFLQGVLLMNLDLIPSYFLPIMKNLENFNKTANKFSMTSLELALSYVYSIKEIDRIIIGVKSVRQLKDIINSNVKCLPLKDVESLSITDPCFLNPSLWPF